jgi:uncharacterized cupredoxin-like copper-binding protein
MVSLQRFFPTPDRDGSRSGLAAPVLTGRDATRLSRGTLLAASVLAAATLALTACTSDAPRDSGYGAPGDPATADRVVEVVASDNFRFTPSEVVVSPGETVTFRVINEGALTHDFTLGDEAAQQRHAEEMAAGHGGHGDQPNVLGLAPGTTGEITWMFPDSGIVLIGCHEPGHYDAGMRGTIRIEG